MSDSLSNRHDSTIDWTNYVESRPKPPMANRSFCQATSNSATKSTPSNDVARKALDCIELSSFTLSETGILTKTSKPRLMVTWPKASIPMALSSGL